MTISLRALGAASLVALGLGACAGQTTTASETAPAAAVSASAQAPAASASFAAVLADPRRDDDRARDAFRNPAETLAFFGITPDMTVGEYSPGGGWYTRVIAPYVADAGAYVAINADVERYMANASEERIASAKAFPQTFPARAAEWTGLAPASIAAMEVDEPADAQVASLDAIVSFRSMHGLARRGMVEETAAHFFTLVKPGGVLGVVQHRAKADAPDAYVDGSNGYLRQADVIAMIENAGFVLEASSEVNANPADTADYVGGVWNLPPARRGENSDEERARLDAIGESDRMTLRFRKPA